AAALVRWPWAALPFAVIGGGAAAQLLGATHVGAIVAVHAILLALGFGTALARARFDPAWHRVRTPADLPMLVLAAAVPVGAAYGLTVGNAPHHVVVAAYEIGIVPAYFFLATVTLAAAGDRRRAGLLFAVGAGAMALVGLMQTGRHGGLYSLVALVPVLAAASTASGSRRRWLLSLAALLALDVVLAGYRAIWVAAVVALAVALVRGSGAVRRTVVSCAVGTALLGATLVLAGPNAVGARAAVAASELTKSAGYRLPESAVGWHVFLGNPLVGGGFGHVEPNRFIPGFGIVDVGPIYHAFYVTLLANAGIVGLALFAWPLVRALRSCVEAREPALPFRALLLGFAAAAVFAAPTDGHWELGALIALPLLAGRRSAPA
ncbi:MAG TPA: O-antigen ligase family protein, partial [Gaiellaceae bacterium]|nr:O-antigen ligase family protein [Gaiellaceae bacterium]